MAVSAPPRPAGIRFATQPPPSARVLPRMDVAAFVGFAESGPIDVPVPVEDTTEYGAVFGGDATLGWDERRGGQAHAQLGPAVRAFFRNGGRRAWVVRVAGGSAERATLPVPGVARLLDGRLEPATLAARAKGAWADGLAVATALASMPLDVLEASGLRLRLAIPASETVAPGDLLRVGTPSHEVLIAVETAEDATAVTAPRGRRVVEVSGSEHRAVGVLRVPPLHDLDGWARIPGRDDPVEASIPAPGSPPAPAGTRTFEVEVAAPASAAPPAGSFVVVEGFSSHDLWIRVESARSGAGSESLRIAGRPFWVELPGPRWQPQFNELARAERLTFELWARSPGLGRRILRDLRFAAPHPRWAESLPTDEELFARDPDEPDRVEGPELWREAERPRFPLAGPEHRSSLLVPLGMEAVPETFLGAEAPTRADSVRNGLAQIDDSLFLDRSLRSARTEALIGQAEFVRYQAPVPRRLEGIHAVLGIDEATLLAMPDAAQPQVIEAAGGVDPDHVPGASEPAPRPEAASFADCNLRILARPFLTPTLPDAGGTFTLTWSATDATDATYRLQESSEPGTFEHAETIYAGGDRSLTLYGRARGVYFFRVRAEHGGNVSDWSPGIRVVVAPPGRYALAAEDDYSPERLLAVQRAALRMCAARGDILCVLSLPEHYRADDAAGHAGSLRPPQRRPRGPAAPGPPPAPGEAVPVPPLDESEAHALGFGALFHPWLTVSLEDRAGSYVHTPPDGPAAGLLAGRTRLRGAWSAPANLPFRDVIELKPELGPEDPEALLGAGVNQVRQEPAGFMTMSADTLADDATVRPIGVRRLLSLLRRLALLHGPRYVFEPNGGELRRGIEAGFESLLATLFRLGAFAGATHAEAFDVEAGDPPNTPGSLERGRLVVELKVAPSRALEFLLVRLVEGSQGGLVVEGP